MSSDFAVARVYLELAADFALRAANLISAVPVDDSNKHEAERMEELGDQVYALLKDYHE